MKLPFIPIMLLLIFQCSPSASGPTKQSELEFSNESKNQIIFSLSDFNDQSVYANINLKREMANQSSEHESHQPDIDLDLKMKDPIIEIELTSGTYSGNITLSYWTMKPLIYNYAAKTTFYFKKGRTQIQNFDSNDFTKSCISERYDQPEDGERIYYCPPLDLGKGKILFKLAHKATKSLNKKWTAYTWGVVILGLFNPVPYYGFLAPVFGGIARFNNEIILDVN